MKRDKKIVIVITIIVSIIMTYGISKIFVTKKENKEIIKEIKKDKTFAIMIQSGDTYKEYISKDNKWPDDNYIFSKAECVDNAGNRIEDAITFNNATRKATLKSKRTIYCTLYFDESNIIKLRDNEKLANKNNLSPEPNQGGMYRYQGTDDVRNWICFGTTDKEECTDETDSDGNDIPDGIDKYMYRIIGINPNGELYLIKETILKENDTTGFSWNDKHYTSGEYVYTCDNKICPEWGENTLFKRLNGTSNGKIQGSGTTNDKADTDIFVDSKEYDYLKSGDNNNGGASSKWYNIIEDHEWLYGDTTDTYYNGNKMYEIETGKVDTHRCVEIDGSCTEQTYRWTEKVIAKISLMYMYDVLYAYPGGNPENYINVANSWIHFKKDGYNTSSSYEWLNTRWGNDTVVIEIVIARLVHSDGKLHNYEGPLYRAHGVRPVFYLSSNAKIASGSGTKSNPFILDF